MSASQLHALCAPMGRKPFFPKKPLERGGVAGLQRQDGSCVHMLGTSGGRCCDRRCFLCQRRPLHAKSLISVASAFQQRDKENRSISPTRWLCRFLSTRWLCRSTFARGGLVALEGPDQPQTPTTLCLLVMVHSL